MNSVQRTYERFLAILKREAWLVLAFVGFGLLLLPAFVYIVGDISLGPYAGGGSLKAFYVNQFRALIDGNGAAWLLALGPYLLIQLVRLLWLPLAKKPAKKTS